MLNNLSIKPGAGNPHAINVKITASATDATLGTVTDFDTFIIPVVSVSSPVCPAILNPSGLFSLFLALFLMLVLFYI